MLKWHATEVSIPAGTGWSRSWSPDRGALVARLGTEPRIDASKAPVFPVKLPGKRVEAADGIEPTNEGFAIPGFPT